MPIAAASSTAVAGLTDPSRCWWSSAFGRAAMPAALSIGP